MESGSFTVSAVDPACPECAQITGGCAKHCWVTTITAPAIPIRVGEQYSVPSAWSPFATGWICPRCSAGVAPHIEKCPCSTPYRGKP